MLAPPYALRTSGRIRNSPRHSTPGTKQGDVMLIVNHAGRGWFRDRRGLRALEAGHVALITPDDPGLLYSDPDDPYDHRFCRFGGAYAHQLVQLILARHEDRIFSPASFEDLEAVMVQLGYFHRQHLPTTMHRNELHLAEMLLLLEEREAPADRRVLDADGIINYLIYRLDRPSDLDDMAQFFKVSTSVLRRALKRHCGMTMLQLHEQLKIERACELLATGEFKIAEVAARVSYEDPLYFSRVFSKRMGCSPRAWRSQHADAPHA